VPRFGSFRLIPCHAPRVGWASVQECPLISSGRACGPLTASELAGADGRRAIVSARTGGRHGRMRSRAAPAPAAGTAWPRATSQPNARNRDFGRGVEGNPLDDRKRPTAGLACHRRETPQGLTSEAWRWYGTVGERSGMSLDGRPRARSTVCVLGRAYIVDWI